MESALLRPNPMPGDMAMVCHPTSTELVSTADTLSTMSNALPMLKPSQNPGAMAMVYHPMFMELVCTGDTHTITESALLMLSPMPKSTVTPLVVSTMVTHTSTEKKLLLSGLSCKPLSESFKNNHSVNIFMIPKKPVQNSYILQTTTVFSLKNIQF